MPIDRFLCPSFEEKTNIDTTTKRTLISFHPEERERKYFETLLEIVNAAPFPMVVVEGIPKDSPIDPDPSSFLATKYGVSIAEFHPQSRNEWIALEYRQYMVMPYSKIIVPVTPLYCVERRVRRYIGPDSVSQFGEIQIMHTLWYDDGSGYGVELSPDMGKLGKLLEESDAPIIEGLGIRSAAGLSADELLAICDKKPFNLGARLISPDGISSEQIQDIRNRLMSHILDNRPPENWHKHGFWSAWLEELLNRQDGSGDWMEGFYRCKKIEFVESIQPQ